MDRREAIGLFGKGLMGLTVAACSRSEAQGTPQAQSSQDRRPATPTLVREKPLSEIAKEEALNTWVELLSSDREKISTIQQAKLVSKLKMEIVSADWKNILAQVVNGKSDIPLRVKWVASQVFDTPSGLSAGAIKWTGEAEFSNISLVQIPRDLNSVDKANRIEWLGEAGVEFRSKARSVYARTSSATGDRVAFQRWISREIPNAELPEFSNPRNDSWFTKLERKNGQWNRTPFNSNRVGALGEVFELPTSVLYFCDPGIGCREISADIK